LVVLTYSDQSSPVRSPTNSSQSDTLQEPYL